RVFLTSWLVGRFLIRFLGPYYRGPFYSRHCAFRRRQKKQRESASAAAIRRRLFLSVHLFLPLPWLAAAATGQAAAPFARLRPSSPCPSPLTGTNRVISEMAFLQKVGNLVKRSTGASSSLYQAVRCMSSSKLFVGGISYGTDEHSLRDAFAGYGEVIEARIIMDRETGRSRGFGFVTYTSTEEAAAALTGMDGKDLHGRIVRVSYAHDRGSRAGGGGYNDGGNMGSGYNTGGSYGVSQGGRGGYGVDAGYTGGTGGYNATPGSFGGDSFNQGGGAPSAYGGGSYGANNNSYADNAPNNAAVGKLDDLLSDLKVDGAGEAEGEGEDLGFADEDIKGEGQDDFAQDDFKDQDEPNEANKGS
ncbi:unnamed protein product, partial [Urochloa humidicola]